MLKKEDAASFLRELADTIEEDDEVKLEGDDYKIYQPYQNIIPFRMNQNDSGLELDIKLLSPDVETPEQE